MTPTPPPGWVVHVHVPTSQQQAQDTVLGYLKKTLTALPVGTTFDATRYGSAASTAPCDDAPASTDPPSDFSAIGELKLSEGDFETVIATVGSTWESWGWWVYERDDFRKPNRFGYSPDGYMLQIKASSPPGAAPTVIGTSPCFPRSLVQDNLDFPVVVTAG